MKKEKILYYLSSMVLFNIFYCIKLLEGMKTFSFFTSEGIFDINNLFRYISIGLAGILFLVGIIYTIVLFNTDYSPQ